MAHGPVSDSTPVPPCGGGSNTSRTFVMWLDPGQVIWVERDGPCAYTTGVESNSRLTCAAPESSWTGVMSKRTAIVVEFGAKKRSRITAARWNCAISAGETGDGTPSTACPVQTLPDVSTYGLSCVL